MQNAHYKKVMSESYTKFLKHDHSANTNDQFYLYECQS